MHLIPTAQAFNFIDVPSGFATSTLSIAGGLFSDFQVPIYLILGVILFGVIVYFLVKIFTHH